MPTSQPPATFISDLRPSRVATFESKVVEVEAVREVSRRDGSLQKVRNVRLKDATGEITLVLWGTQVDSIDQGDHIRIIEGWVSDYRGRPQVALGRSGKLEKIGHEPSTPGEPS